MATAIRNVRHIDRSLADRMIHVLQKPDVRPVRYPCQSHHLSQIVGVGEETGALQVIPGEEEQDLLRVGGVAEDPPALGAIGLPRGRVLIEDRLPGGVVHDVVTDEQRRHGHRPPRASRDAPDGSTPCGDRQYVLRRRRPIRTSTHLAPGAYSFARAHGRPPTGHRVSSSDGAMNGAAVRLAREVWLRTPSLSMMWAT